MTRLATPADVGLVRRRAHAVVVLCLAVILAGMAMVSDGRAPGCCQGDLFRVVNDLPGALYRVLWPFHQLGVVAAGPVVAVVAWLVGRRRLAVAALLRTLSSWPWSGWSKR